MGNFDSLTDLHVFGQCEEAKVPGENIQTPHRKNLLAAKVLNHHELSASGLICIFYDKNSALPVSVCRQNKTTSKRRDFTST